MPIRPWGRQRTWLFPPTLEELIPADHPARFVGGFVEELDRAAWLKLEVAVDGDPLGAPSYDPRMLLCVWLYGFMTGVRSTRKLEAACRDQLPYLWLTGWGHPDHNTLWRFYQAHREQMRELFKRTVKTAVRMGLVDLAVQAVDGTKIAGNAAKERTFDADGLRRLLERTDAAIAELEAQNEAGGDPSPPRLPKGLAETAALREQIQQALEAVMAEDGPKRVNLTDPDAQLMKGRQGYVAGYNAQAMVSPVKQETAGRTGLFITAAEVGNCPADQDRLLPMIAQAEENTGDVVNLTLADGGYHSGSNLASCAEQGYPVAMPESNRKAGQAPDPYGKDAFIYDQEMDTFTCPKEQTLRFVGEKHRKGRPVTRVYRASPNICLACPAFGVCTTDRLHGRMLEIGPHELVLRNHRTWMATAEAKTAYRQRKQLPEPTFGILKEQQGARRFLLRGIERVRAEWTLLVTAFNLRTLYRIWASWQTPEPRNSGALLASGAA
jgi:transposase